MSMPIRKRVAVAFPGKEILIGETGWPSAGRMRDGALPSRANQARVVSEILDARASAENFRVNLIEAYDQPWKRALEGTVGGYWGLYRCRDRALKYPAGDRRQQFSALEDGRWRAGMALCVADLRGRRADAAAAAVVAAAVGLDRGRRYRRRRRASCSASRRTSMMSESYGIGGWLRWGAAAGGRRRCAAARRATL